LDDTVKLQKVTHGVIFMT